MSRINGRPLAGRDHLVQDIGDVLTTPLGTRVMLPAYGSLLPRLADQPANAAWRSACVAATAEALARWLPHLELRRTRVSQPHPGAIAVDVEGHARAISAGDFEGPLVASFTVAGLAPQDLSAAVRPEDLTWLGEAVTWLGERVTWSPAGA